MSQPAPSAPRLLRRSREDRVIAGVCGGLGRYLGIDPVLLRIAFVVLALAGGGGVILYLVCWILIPEERPGEELGGSAPSGADALRLVVGGLLVVVGLLLLIQMSVPRIGRYVWPLALIAVGVAVLVQAAVRR
jgi:phage shock protein C